MNHAYIKFKRNIFIMLLRKDKYGIRFSQAVDSYLPRIIVRGASSHGSPRYIQSSIPSSFSHIYDSILTC